MFFTRFTRWWLTFPLPSMLPEAYAKRGLRTSREREIDTRLKAATIFQGCVRRSSCPARPEASYEPGRKEPSLLPPFSPFKLAVIMEAEALEIAQPAP